VKKKKLPIIVIVLVVLVCLIIAKDLYLKPVVTIGAKSVLGTNVEIGRFKISFLGQKVIIKDFKIAHPKGYEEGYLIDIPEISVDFNAMALLKGKLHLPLLVVNMKEMIVIKNKDGVLNVDELKVVKEGKEAEGEEQKEQPKKKKKEMEMQIDRMVLTVGKVISKEYGEEGEEPLVEVFDVGIEEKEYTE